MTRELTPNRWNWSDKDQKWVYIELTGDGQKKYYYQLEPPKEFVELTMKIKLLNDKMIATNDTKENLKLFEELTKISHKMQNMRFNNE
jgi:hypothetical protein